MNDINYRLEIFEGPLDLLLSLIAKNKVDIKDIPIALIFEQYMEYIALMQSFDMEVAGEFIVMASELMLIKSKMLLPKDETNAEDPRAALAEALIEYKKAKEVAAYLESRFETFNSRYVKDTDEIKVDKNIVSEQDIALLARAFRRMINRRREDEENAEKKLNPNVRFFDDELKKEIIQIPDRIKGVVVYLESRGTVSFEELMYSSRSRSELIATFGAILELLKSGQVTIFEPEPVDENGEPQIILSLNADYIPPTVDEVEETEKSIDSGET